MTRVFNLPGLILRGARYELTELNNVDYPHSEV